MWSMYATNNKNSKIQYLIIISIAWVAACVEIFIDIDTFVFKIISMALTFKQNLTYETILCVSRLALCLKSV